MLVMIRLEEMIAREYAALPMVEAVALGGSLAGPFADAKSDHDIYVYSKSVVPVEARVEIARRRSRAPETDNRWWEPGDEWTEADGQRADVMFRETAWIEEQLARVLDRHEASIGYSTAFWFNVKTSKSLFDRHGWFARLQERAAQPYPEELRRNIIAKNHPILRSTQSSYTYQIERALERGDVVAVNHRVAALLASFFDVLFAVNGQAHPGEKRLIGWSERLCPARPEGMSTLVPEIIQCAARGDVCVVGKINELLDGLDQLI